MAEAAKKLNFTGKVEYFDLPYSAVPREFTGEKLTRAGYNLYGVIHSLSAKRGNVALSYDDMHEITGQSTSTLAENLSTLKSSGLISQDKSNRSHTRYKVEKKAKKGDGFIRIDKELFRIIEDLYGNIHLTETQKTITAFMVGIATSVDKRTDKVRKKYVGSYAAVGKVVGCHEETARLAIKKIVKADLFHVPKGKKGTSKMHASEYIIDTDLRLAYGKVLERRKLEAIAKSAAKSSKAERAAKPRQTKQEQYADEQTERNRFYSANHNTAISHADRAKRLAERDEAYKNADKLVRQTEIQIYTAERDAPHTLPDLQRKLEESKARRASALKRLGLTEADFDPKFTCMKCSDTGFMADGMPCDCYKPKPKGERP